MTKLFIKCTILGIPLLLLIGVCTAVGLYVGEVYPLSYVAQRQAENRQINYSIVGERIKQLMYKTTSVRVQQPEVVLMSSSRGWYFKDFLSNHCTRDFYNASVIHASVNELLYMVEEFVQLQQKPEVILLSLDYPDYNLESEFRTKSRVINEMSDWEHAVDSIQRSIVHVAVNPTITTKLLNMHPNLDLGWGFLDSDNTDYYRGDGSYHADYFEHSILEQEIDSYLNLIANGEAQFEYGTAVDEHSLESLSMILQLAADNEIEVIGFFPPFHPDVLSQLQNNDHYDYIPLVYDAVQHLFDRYDFPVYEFSDIDSVGGNADGMYDGWHTGELLSTRIYLQLLRNEPEILSKYSDIAYLEQRIDSSTDPYDLNIDPDELMENQSC